MSTVERNPSWAGAHRGLAMLYENQDRLQDAAREFRTSLELAPPDAPDRLRIERRLENVSQGLRDRGPRN